MRYFLIGLGVCWATFSFSLPLSTQGKQEARLFSSFLKSVYLQQQNPQQAFESFQKTLALDPDSKYIRRILVSLALTMNKPEWAEPYLDYIELEENDSEDWTVYAMYQWKTGHQEQARQSYEKALALDPENQAVLYQYLSLLSAVDLDKMVEMLEGLIRQQPQVACAAYLEIGRLYARRQQPDKAFAYFDKAIAADNTDPAPRLAKGELYEQTAQYFLMLHEFEEVEKMGYANAGVLSRMGAVFLLVKDYPEAEAYFLKAKALDKSDAPSNYFLAILAEQRGDFARAIGYLKDASDYSSQPSRWLQVSFYQQRLNQPAESLNTLAEAYKLFGESAEIGFFYGLALNDHQQYKKATQVFEKLLKTNPDYTEARLHYAYALESLKKYSKMEAQIQRILMNNPQHAPALNLWAYSLAQRNIRLEEAHQYIVRARQVAPEEASFIDTQAFIYFQQGNVEEADRLLSSIPAQAIAQNPEIAYHVALVRLEQNRPEEALRYLEMAQDNWPEADKLYRQLKK